MMLTLRQKQKLDEIFCVICAIDTGRSEVKNTFILHCLSDSDRDSRVVEFSR